MIFNSMYITLGESGPPKVKLRVVDSNGSPFSGLTVNNLIDSTGQVAVTDSDGYANGFCEVGTELTVDASSAYVDVLGGSYTVMNSGKATMTLPAKTSGIIEITESKSITFRCAHKANLTVGSGGYKGSPGDVPDGGSGGKGGNIQRFLNINIYAGTTPITCGEGQSILGPGASSFGTGYSSASGSIQVVTINGKDYGGSGGKGGHGYYIDDNNHTRPHTQGSDGTGAGGKGGRGASTLTSNGIAGYKGGPSGGGGGGGGRGRYDFNGGDGGDGGSGFVVIELLS